MPMEALGIWQIGECFFIAPTADAAQGMDADMQGYETLADYCEDDPAEPARWPDDRPFVLTSDDWPRTQRVAMPATWAEENGPGFFASTED